MAKVTKSKQVCFHLQRTLWNAIKFYSALKDTLDLEKTLLILKLSTNVSSAGIRTKGEPVLLMENLVTIAKTRGIFQSVVRISIQKLTLSNKIWILVTQIQSFSTMGITFYRCSWRWQKLPFRKRVDNWLISKPDTTANIVPENCFLTLKSKSKLHKPNAKLTAYNGSRIPV